MLSAVEIESCVHGGDSPPDAMLYGDDGKTRYERSKFFAFVERDDDEAT